jgi:translocation and assembly module TamA
VTGATLSALAQSDLSPAEGFETIGQPVSYDVEFIFEGDSSVEKALKNASALWRDRDKPASGTGGLLASARGDYQRILRALYAEGYYGGVISITANGREISELRTGDPISAPVSITIAVNPGPPFVFGKTQIVNQAPLPIDPEDAVPPPESAGFVTGAPAQSGAIVRAEALAIDAWREQGHPNATATREVVALHDRNELDVQLNIDPGPKAFYGTIQVNGAVTLDPGYVAWMADLPAGEEYDPDDVRRANKRLTRLGVFSSVRIEEAEQIEPSGELPIEIFVQERKPRRIGLGASFDTIDGLGVEGTWLHRNLFGRAEQLRFDLRIGGLTDTFDLGEYDYRFTTTFIRPGVSTPDTDQFFKFTAEREVLDAYTRNGISAEAGFEHRISDQLTWRTALNGGAAHFDDDVFGERSFTQMGLYGQGIFDSRDSQYDPTRGIYSDLFLDPYYEFGYGNAVMRGIAEGRAYLGVGDSLVLAARARLGSLAGSEIAETSPDKLFFAGGGGSVRGYAYRNIGVPVGDDEIVGGRSLIEGSVELRARLSETIGLAAFVDAGYVDPDPFPDFSNDLRVGVGGGLRYYTSFAPIRFDIAFPLDPGDGDPDVAFYVGIGQAF